MKYYILKKGDYYLSDYNVYYEADINDPDDYLHTKVYDFMVGKEVQKLFADFDEAEEIRKEIYIETGLNFEIKIFRKEEE